MHNVKLIDVCIVNPCANADTFEIRLIYMSSNTQLSGYRIMLPHPMG